jgi:hypothetical protein
MRAITPALFRLGAVASMLAGLLRIGTSFLGYGDTSPALELFYLGIDLCILFGIITIYLYQHVELGKPGILGFVAAIAGTAIIVGPDGYIGSVDMYPAGSALILFGLAVIAVVGWRPARLPRYALASWLLSVVFGLCSVIPGAPPVILALAGISFGVGFLGAGIKIWSKPSSS